MEISEEQRKSYVSERDNFLKRREEVEKELGDLDKIILENVNKKTNLRNSLNATRPKLEDCDEKTRCVKCDIYSMKYQGGIPKKEEITGREKTVRYYQCILCGYDKQKIVNST